jgi:hypothetical protein
MKILKISEGADPNYLATIVKCPELKPHPNADRLELLTVFGNDVIVAKGMYFPGELLCYFPVESCISQKFLSWANLLDKAELNADGKTKGFFGAKNGRVKAIALRSIPSQGFVYKVSKLAEYYEIEEKTFSIGDTFDTVGDDILVKKYIKGDSRGSGGQNSKKSRVPEWLNKTINIFPRPIRRNAYIFVNAWYNRDNEGIKSQIMDGEFRYHYKTEHLGKNVYLVNPSDFITITSKWHGTSAIYSNIICKKSFNPLRSIANKFGANIPDKEYKFVYSSRSVIKNRRDGKLTDDVWGIIASELQGNIPEGYTVYGEIVGHTPGGKTIQKNYDYGVPKNECEFRVYRITYNLTDGYRELEWYEIEEFCHEHGLKTVHVYYNGLAKDLFDIPLDKDWQDNFLSKMKETYLDNPCEFCTTGVVNEGVVLRLETKEHKTALKFKSPLFVIGESRARDNDEVDMEEES